MCAEHVAGTWRKGRRGSVDSALTWGFRAALDLPGRYHPYVCSTGSSDGPDALSDGGLLEHVGELVAEQNRLAARLARAVRKAENRQAAEHDGLKTMKSWLKTMKSWLTTHIRLSGPAVAGIVRQGRALEVLAAVEAAFLAGHITGDQVETIAEIVKPEYLDRAQAQDIDLSVVADALVTIAATQPHRELQKAVGVYLSTWPSTSTAGRR